MAQSPWKITLPNVKQFLSSFDFCSHTSRLEQIYPCAKLGLDMIRMPFSLNFQSDQVTHKHVHQTFSSLSNIAKKLSVSTEAFAPSCIDKIANTPHSIASYTCPYDTFLDSLHNQSYAYVITVQDKDPSVAWLQDPMCMMSRWHHMLKSASSRWQIVDLKISDFLQIYRSSINGCLPRFILRDATIHYENLPIVYPTIKRKCFAGHFDVFYFGHRAFPYMPIRTCDKSSHSCFRNIVSFASMPGARQFRAVSRALRHMIAHTLQTYSIENMSKICDELREAFGELMKNENSRRCLSCHCGMCGPTVATWDAGQAYEILNPTQVLRDLDHVCTRCEAAGSGLLQIWHSARSLVGFSKSLHRSLNDRVVLVTHSIKSCVRAYMKMRIFRFCNIFLKQVSGVPIGGWLSSALLNLSAGACESRFEARYTQFPATQGLDLPRSRIFAINAMKTMFSESPTFYALNALVTLSLRYISLTFAWSPVMHI